jgi:hypothetical protein
MLCALCRSGVIRIVNLKTFLAGFAALCAFAGPCHAAFIGGGITFSDRFDASGATTLAQGCSGSFGPGFCVPSPGTEAFGFVAGMPGQTLFQYDGFTFTIGSFDAVTHEATCNANVCTDYVTFIGTGVVTGRGFDVTPFSIAWSGQVSCEQGVCNGAMNSGLWSARINAAAVPEAGTLALLCLGIGLMLVMVHRRSA